MFTNKVLLYGGLALASIATLNKYCNGGVNDNKSKLTGKVIIITGANSGIGKVCVKELAKLKPAKIIMACRSKKRGMKALIEIREKLNLDKDMLELMLIDLADQESIVKFVKEFKSKYDRLDVLLNNGGIMALPKR